MRRFVRLVSLVLGLNVFVGFAHAHHSQAGIFDSRKTIEVSGVVKSVSWRNPHGQILLSVKDEKGVETVWDAETASISILRNRGVDGSSIRVGDRVTIAGSPSMRNRPEILARSVLLPNGNEFTFGSANAYFASRESGASDRRCEDRWRCRCRESQGRRSVPRLVHDHERPRRVSDVQGGLSADRRRQGRACEMESAQQHPSEVRHEGHAADHDFSAADGVQQGGRQDHHAARRVRHGAHDPHESEGRGAARRTRCSAIRAAVGKARRWWSRPITLRLATSITRARRRATRSRPSSASSRTRTTAVSTTP